MLCFGVTHKFFNFFQMKNIKLFFYANFFLMMLTQCGIKTEKLEEAIIQIYNDFKPLKIEIIEGFNSDTDRGKTKFIGLDIIRSPIIEKMTEKEKKFNASNFAFKVYNCLDSVERNNEMVVRIILSNEKSQNFNFRLNHLKVYKQSFDIIHKFFQAYKSQDVTETFELYSDSMISKHKEALSSLFLQIERIYGEVKELEMLGYEVTGNPNDEIKVNVGVYTNNGNFLWTFNFEKIDNEVKIDGINF